MSDVKNWPAILKSSLDATHYLAVTSKKKLQVISLFPSLATVGTGIAPYTGITFQNQLNFRSLLSTTTGMLTIAAGGGGDAEFTILPGGIALSACNNDVPFLSTVDLTADVGATVLPVANGGTSVSTITKGALLYASAANTITETSPFSTDGLLYIGNTATGVGTLATLTAGTNVSIVNGGGSITISANLATLAATLDTDTYNINLNAGAGTSWVSGDGTSEGLTIDASGRAFIGDSTPTLPSLAAQLTLGGNATNALSIGNNNNYGNRTIKMVDSTGAAAGATLTIEGATGGTGAQNGGDVKIEAGACTGASTGGDVNIVGGGEGASGTAGAINLKTAAAETTGLTVDASQNVLVPNGFVRYSQTPQSLSGAGAVDITSQITHFTDTGANALTLADGAEGQTKMICQIATSGGAGTLGAPTKIAGWTSITFNAVGENVHLLFTNGKWHIIGIQGATPA